MMFETFKVKIIDKREMSHYNDVKDEDIFDVVGTVGDKLLLCDKDGALLEIYSRRCKRINW